MSSNKDGSIQKQQLCMGYDLEDSEMGQRDCKESQRDCREAHCKVKLLIPRRITYKE